MYTKYLLHQNHRAALSSLAALVSASSYNSNIQHSSSNDGNSSSSSHRQPWIVQAEAQASATNTKAALLIDNQSKKAAANNFGDNNNNNDHHSYEYENNNSSSIGIDSDEIQDVIQTQFLILGQGKAGKAARKVLTERAASASVCVVDLFHDNLGDNRSKNIQTVHGAICEICPLKKYAIIQKFNGEKVRVEYQSSALIATGSRGAPLPTDALFDKMALTRTLEYKSTTLPPIFLQNRQLPDPSNMIRPVMSQYSVKKLIELAASEGARICVVGSGLDALELVALSIDASKENKSNRSNKKSRRSKSNNMTLVFGSSSTLMDSRLPRYLSLSLLKRLKALTNNNGEECLVNVCDHSLVRYVALQDADYSGSVTIPGQCLEIYTSKVYDLMDSSRLTCDLLAVVPSVEDLKGSAILSSYDGADNSSFKSWTDISKGSIVTYKNDGRIAVNNQLYCSNSIYAAGSVARFPETNSGTAMVVSKGGDNAVQSGKFAANRMCLEFERLENKSVRDEDSNRIYNSKLSTSVDLPQFGMSAVFVGDCNAETMASHGFWWTNRAKNRRLSRRRSLNLQRRASSSKIDFKPVYGVGLVYYFDSQTGAISGAMVWGLPNLIHSPALKDICTRLDETISSNGSNLLSLSEKELEASHLMDESKRIVSTFIGCNSEYFAPMQLSDGHIAKPLHIFEPSKPIQQRMKLGWRQRSGETTPNEIFTCNQNYSPRPPSLLKIFDYRATPSDEELLATKNIELGRPLEEDPIWLRKNDTSRMQASSDKLYEAYRYNIGVTAGENYYDGNKGHKWLE